MPGEVTIDFGIDLGTTNSNIAVFADGELKIIKCGDTDADVTPSVVSRAGSREFIGAAARNRLVTHPGTTFSEFKRDIGTTTTYLLPDGARVGPEELSAAVLRSLLEDAFAFAKVNVTAAVITVPAAFNAAQIAATLRAGEMAGLAHVETLQEPIAAALAYGLERSGDGVYLVFDLGGGTFDSALLRCAGGVFSVINHRGDNDLGGGKWDSAIVDRVLLPKLLELEYKVETARDRKSELFKLLKSRAEVARLELSRKESTSFTFTIGDEEDRPLPDDISITRLEFEPLIESDLSRCLDFCRELLEDAGLSPSAIDRLILVGGPTRTPALRTAVESIGVEVAAGVDPMTIVARGAAVYAASRPRPVVAPSAVETAVFQLTYDAMVEGDKDQVVVGLKLERAPEGSNVSTVRVDAADGSWKSGSITMEDDGAIITVKLGGSAVSDFRISALTSDQTPLDVIPNSFSVTRGVAAGAAPVNHSIGVGVDAALGGDGVSVDSIVSRGSTMPVFIRRTYRTTRIVTPREPDADPIHLLFLEGESDVPERNLKVGEIVIQSDEITRPLPANSEIEVSIRWEQGQDPKASAYIPFLDQQFDSVLTMQNMALPDVGALEEQVAKIRGRIEGGLDPSDERSGQLREIETRLADARKGDAAAAHSAAAGVGPLLDAIEAESGDELKKAAEAELQEAEEWARDIVAKHGTAEDQAGLESLIKEARGAVAGGTHRDIDFRRDRVMQHAYGVVLRQPGFWIGQFSELSEKAGESSDPVRAGELIQRGNVALNQQDIAELTNIVRELWNLFPDSSDPMRSFGIRKT